MTQLTRRSTITGIATGAFTIAFSGVSSAGKRGEYVVSIAGNGVAERIERAGFSINHELAGGDVLLLSGPANATAALQDVRGVRTAIADFQFALEMPAWAEDSVGIEPDQIFLPNQWDNGVIDAEAAHEAATGTGRRIAIIDTGVDHTHFDLGNVDIDDSVTIFRHAVGPHVGDIQGHGTHVASIAGATGSVGVVGVAPEAEIVSIRVFEWEDVDGEEELVATFGDILLAMEYSADIGVDAANMSLGTLPIPPQANAEQLRAIMEPVAQSVTVRGTLLVGSAGNSAATLQQGGFFTLPNSLQGVMSISATAPDDALSFYSNFGTNEIDVGAPGGGYGSLEKTLCGYQEWLEAGAPPLINLDPRVPGETGTLWLDGDGNPTTDPEEVVEAVECEIPPWPVPFNFVFGAFPGGYGWAAGTSMAAPQVTGAAALVRELDPGSTPRQVERAIMHGADLVEGRNDPHLGAGRLSLSGLLDAV